MTESRYVERPAELLSFWVRHENEPWRLEEFDALDDIWDFVTDRDLLVSPFPAGLYMCAGRCATVLPGDDGPDGLHDVVRLSRSPVAVVPE